MLLVPVSYFLALHAWHPSLRSVIQLLGVHSLAVLVLLLGLSSPVHAFGALVGTKPRYYVEAAAIAVACALLGIAYSRLFADEPSWYSVFGRE